MIITDISSQKAGNRFNVYVDGKFWCGLSNDALLRGNLFQGKNVNKELLEEVLIEEIVSRLISRSMKKVTRRPHSISEIRNFCKRTMFKKSEDWLNTSLLSINDTKQDEIVALVVTKLRKLDLLNDQDFANWWFNNRRNYKPRSLFMIKGELMQKRVDAKIIENLDFSSEIEFEMADKLVNKRFNIDRFSNFECSDDEASQGNNKKPRQNLLQDSKPEPKPKPEPEPESESKSEPKSKPESESKSKPKPEPESELESGPKQKRDSDLDLDQKHSKYLGKTMTIYSSGTYDPNHKIDKQKIIKYLQNKKFPWDIIKRVLDKYSEYIVGK